MDKSGELDCENWYVPINFAHSKNASFDNTKPSHWLVGKSGIINSVTLNEDDWIILNKQKTGFYRVDYDLELWLNIIQVLEKDFHSIHRNNRLQLVDDAFSLASNDRLNLDTLVSLLSTYTQETDSFIRDTIFSAADKFVSKTRIYSPDLEKQIQKIINSQYFF